MADSAVALAPRSLNVVSAAGVVVAVAALAALLLWPPIAMLAHGIAVPPQAIVVSTIAIAVSSTLGILVIAGMLAAAVRARLPGSGIVRAVCRAGLCVPPFVAPVALLALAGSGALYGGFADARLGQPGAIVVAQIFAFLPAAFALVMRALAAVSAEAEQAAELLGASRWTVRRRVTLGLARPGLISAACVVLGLCLADVATGVLFGAQDWLLAVYIVTPADSPATWTGGALLLSALTLTVALAGRTWRVTGVPISGGTSAAAGLTSTAAARAIVAPLSWLITAALVVLWVTVPAASLIGTRPGWHLTLEHWGAVGHSTAALANSLLLGLGVAIVGTILALLAGIVIGRGRGITASVTTLLTRVPVVIPGVVAGLGYLLAFGAPHGDLALLVLVVAAWELPVTASVAAGVLARSDRAREQAALSLGAGRFMTLRRIVLPSLMPATAWIVGYGFASGLTAVATVIAIISRGRLDLGVADMLLFAVVGPAGPACAIATGLVVIAAGVRWVAGAAAGRESIPTLLA
jgi:iron(III) transport system permease protein